MAKKKKGRPSLQRSNYLGLLGVFHFDTKPTLANRLMMNSQACGRSLNCSIKSGAMTTKMRRTVNVRFRIFLSIFELRSEKKREESKKKRRGGRGAECKRNKGRSGKWTGEQVDVGR
jgi:hypothetical protein